jgi:hypothetical protein
MSGFDFIGCTTKAYTHVWNGRREIGRLCGAVILFKVLSFVAVILLDMDLHKLRQGLLLLPSYFLEGWAICLVIAGLSTQAGARKRDALAGAIVYTLVKLGLSFLLGMTLEGQGIEAAPAPGQGSPLFAFGIAVVMLGFAVWAFRFLWVYVPVALGYGIEDYLRGFKTPALWFSMVGLWLLCFVPFALGLLATLQILAAIIPAGAGAGVPALFMNAAGIAQAVFDFFVSLVSSLAMAYAVISVMEGRKDRGRTLF